MYIEQENKEPDKIIGIFGLCEKHSITFSFVEKPSEGFVHWL